MSDENMIWAARTMREASEKAEAASYRMEQAAHRIALMLEDGYGGNGLRLLDALENLKLEQSKTENKP